jgi:hypothetical protein
LNDLGIGDARGLVGNEPTWSFGVRFGEGVFLPNAVGQCSGSSGAGICVELGAGPLLIGGALAQATKKTSKIVETRVPWVF